MGTKKRFTYKAVLRGLLPYIVFVLVSIMLVNVEMVCIISSVAEKERKQGAEELEKYIKSVGGLQNGEEDFGQEDDLRAFFDLQRQYFESRLSADECPCAFVRRGIDRLEVFPISASGERGRPPYEWDGGYSLRESGG